MREFGRLEDILPFRRRSGVPPRAGIFLLDGRFHVAAPGTDDESRLLDRGALEVAAVTFDLCARPIDCGVLDADVPVAHLPLGTARTGAASLGWRPARN